MLESPANDPKYQSGQECQVHFPAGETVREAGLSLAVSQIFLVKPVDLLGSQCLVVLQMVEGGWQKPKFSG